MDCFIHLNTIESVKAIILDINTKKVKMLIFFSNLFRRFFHKFENK